MINNANLLTKVKANLIIEDNSQDTLLSSFITAAVAYACGKQNHEPTFYQLHPIPVNTEHAIVMLASFYFESRDGSSGGFFASSPGAAAQSLTVVDKLLDLDKEWKF